MIPINDYFDLYKRKKDIPEQYFVNCLAVVTSYRLCEVQLASKFIQECSLNAHGCENSRFYFFIVILIWMYHSCFISAEELK